MTLVNEKNLLEFIIDYSTDIGCNHEEASNYFTANRFMQGVVLNLPAVCLMPGNKPATSKSKQTHIHVTSKSCYFFYDETELDTVSESTPWEKCDLKIMNNNISALNGSPVSPTLSISDSYMMTKIECRKTQEKQVQLSKIRDDHPLFIDLRNGLYENDMMVFLKYRNSDSLFAIGIPKSFFSGKYEFETQKNGKTFRSETYSALISHNAIPVKTAIENVMSEHSSEDVVESEDMISDAVYQSTVDAAEASSTTYTPVEYVETKPNGSGSKSNRPHTNPSIGKEALIDSHYTCAINAGHTSFIKPDNTKYMEVHHLIPMNQQKNFKYKLDNKANILPLCPNCHRMLHHGRFKDIEHFLTELYEKRKDALSESGLNISLDDLLSFYM